MNVSDLNLEGLLEHVSRVQARLSRSSTLRSLLDRARADTPIIDELLDQIALMLKDKSLRHRKKVIGLAERDLLVLLALRELEREQHDKAESRLRAAMN